jgi:hypothetical protein
VTVYSKCTSALTFENICQADALEAKEKLKTQLDGVMVQLKAAQQRTAFLDQALATAQVTLLKDKENKRRDSSQGDTTIRITSSMSPSQRKKQWEAKETLRLSSNSPSSNSPTTDSLPRWAQEDLKRAQREGGASALAMHHASSAVEGGGGGGRERESLFAVVRESLFAEGTTAEPAVNTSLSVAVREESGSALAHTPEAKVSPRSGQVLEAREGGHVPLPGGNTNRPTTEQKRPTTEQKSPADTPDTRHKGIADAQPTTEQKRPTTEQKSPADTPDTRDKSTDKVIADAQQQQEGQLPEAEQQRREQEEGSARQREAAQERRRAAEVCPCFKRDLF